MLIHLLVIGALAVQVEWKVQDQILPAEAERIALELDALMRAEGEASGGTQVQLQLFAYGGPNHILLIIERPGHYEAEARASLKLERARMNGWREQLAPVLRTLLGPAPEPVGPAPLIAEPSARAAPIVPLVLLGVGAVALGTGIGFHLHAQGAHGDLLAGTFETREFEPLLSGVEQDTLVAQVCFTAALIGFGTALVLNLTR